MLDFEPRHEAELNPVTGQRWRWLSDHGELQYVMPGSGGTLRLAGESPRKYYARDSRLIVRAGTEVLLDTTVSEDFAVDVKVPATRQPATLVVETDQTHVPAESRWRRSPDHRVLCLRIVTCELRSGS